MNSTIKSIKLLTKILWNISSNKERIRAFLIILFSIFSSFLQYVNIIITAITFSFITSSAYSENNNLEFDFLFNKKIQLESDSFINLIFIWIFSSIISYGFVIIASFLIHKLAYFFGRKLSKKSLDIAINSNSFFFESISEKTLFNLFSAENNLLIKGSIMSLIIMPMQISIIFSLLTIIVRFSLDLFIILPFIALFYILITNLVFKSVSKKGSILFDLRSSQTDILSRIIDNYLDVKFPPSDKAYKYLYNNTTNKIRNLEAIIATIPKALKSFLELIFILMIGSYIIYNLYFLDLPLEKFIGSSAAIVLSLLKLTPILSGISSNFLSFNAQYETIKNFYDLLFKSNKYSLFSNDINYSIVNFGGEYRLNFDDIKSNRISKFSKDKSLKLTLSNKKLLWIIGKSGCGKSTFLSMVAGIRPINKGQIKLTINKKFQKKQSNFIHEYIAYMPQNPIFHSIKVVDYIKDGDTYIDNSQIKMILKKLKISDSFNMNETKLLDQVIGPRGYNPSGGQAKLLSFARALCKRNVYLYLLDEPTSDLSEEYKEIVLNAIFEIAKEKFVLCITHDLNAISSNQQILSL